MGYISRRAKLGRVLVEGMVTILGPTVVGDNSMLGYGVILGYPTRAALKRLIPRSTGFESYDLESRGCIIGEGCIIRPYTMIYEGSILGNGVETGHFVMIRENVQVGDCTLIGSYTVIDGDASVGCETRIQTGCYIPPETVIGDRVFLGPMVTMLNDKYPPSGLLAGVRVEDGAVVGAGSIVMAGVTIGERAVVGAGSVVTKDVEPGVVVVGSPAKPVYTREKYEAKRRTWMEQISKKCFKPKLSSFFPDIHGNEQGV